MALLDAFAAGGLEYRAAFNESAAVLMAATEAQLTGLPGVVVLSLAPGVSNGLNGLLNAYLDEVPLIVISGQHPAAALPFVIRQGFDLDSLVAPMTDVAGQGDRRHERAAAGRAGRRPGDVRAAGPGLPGDPDCRRGRAEHGRRRETTATVARLHRALAQPVACHAGRRPVRGRHPAQAPGERPQAGARDRGQAGQAAPADRRGVLHRVPHAGLRLVRPQGHAGHDGALLRGHVPQRQAGAGTCSTTPTWWCSIDPESYDFYNRPWCFDAPTRRPDHGPTFTEWGNPIDERARRSIRTLPCARCSTRASTRSRSGRPSTSQGYRDRPARPRCCRPGRGRVLGRRTRSTAALDAWPTRRLRWSRTRASASRWSRC